MSDRLRDEVVALTRRLVAIPTEYPPGETVAACELVGDELAAAGFTVRTFEEEPGIRSVIAEHRFSADGPTLVFNGHLDVVPLGDSAGQWTHDPWGGELVDGRLYGRGTQDMKGAVAAVIVAARRAVAENRPLRGKLVVLAVADEEGGGGRGTGALVRAGLVEGDGAVVAEPGDAGIVIGHRGLCFVRLTTHGRSAHASMPSMGVNAVGLMVDALCALRTVRLRHEPHPVFGGPSLVAGTSVHGGLKANVIPDTCVATCDVRTVPGMTAEAVVDDVRRHLAATALGPDVVTVEVTNWGQPGETPVDARIVGVCRDAFVEELGTEPEVRYMPAFTDGGWMANGAGVPSVMAFGPGEIAGCHIVDESVDVAELERYARIYGRVIDRFLAVAPAP
jgi:acetylornithine deacetylase/succinyl-diaminopimelate desuccinylase family protein